MKQINVGFTGTRHGMSDQQKESFLYLLIQLQVKNRIIQFHHGDCVGADEDSFWLVTRNNKLIVTIAHPCTLYKFRAHTESDEVRSILPPLDRNKNIVNGSHIMIATPLENSEQQKGGTWSTIRYAKKQKHITHLYVIFNDGQIEDWKHNV